MKTRWNEILFGSPKDPLNPKIFHVITLVAFFAWIGLGADGLSSSCYGPEEAFLALRKHPILALPLACAVSLTIAILSAAYSQLIEVFPSGGGGYLVSTKLLGKTPGLVCGWALVLDYILTIAVSVSSGVDAIFSFLPGGWAGFKLYATLAILFTLILINLRGVKESILALMPIFVVFIILHGLGILASIIQHSDKLPGLFAGAPAEIQQAAQDEGGWTGLIAFFLAAYAIGGGTYTGIEAVSNSMQVLREPRVATGKKTMLYMAASLAFTASGILLGYLLLDVKPEPHRTLNAVLFDGIYRDWSLFGIPLDGFLIPVTLISEGALLFVAAQAGFIGGPRTLATMAIDRWVPNRFSQLSNRLVVQDGVVFMGVCAAAFVIATGAQVKVLVILYSINVFITFTLSQLGMCIHWFRSRRAGVRWKSRITVNSLGLLLSVSMLAIMVYFKFAGGGWLTLLLTAGCIAVSWLVYRHYGKVRSALRKLDPLLEAQPVPASGPPPARVPGGPTAVLLVSGFNGLGMHSFYAILRAFPAHFKNFLFISVGVVDYEEFKGSDEVANLKVRTRESLEKYVRWSLNLGLYAEHRSAVGTDLVDEIVKLADGVVKEFPGAIFFGGQLVFQRENFFTRSLHSQSAFEIQRRLQFAGLQMVLLPIRMQE